MAEQVLLDLSSSAVHKTSTASKYVGGYALDGSKQPAALAIVLDGDGLVLTVSRPEPPFEMSLPGGHVEDGEDARAAAGRETGEETGVQTGDLEFLRDLASPTDGRNVSVYRAKSWSGTALPLEPSTRVAWMSAEELLAQATLFRPTIQALYDAGAFAPKGKRTMTTAVNLISADKRNALPEGSFALPAQRKYPLDTAARTRNAAARLVQMKKKGKISDADYATAKKHIATAAKKFGIESEFNEADKPSMAHAKIHVAINGLAHGGSIHVRHSSDRTVFLENGTVQIDALEGGTFRLRDVRSIAQDVEEVDPASLGVTLKGPATWKDGSPKKLVWVQVAACGSWKGHPSGPFEMTPATMAEMKRNFDARNLAIAWDMGHASEADETSGTLPLTGAPAHGWVHRLDARGLQGLWAATEWFDYARDAIKAGQFAYMSPAVRFGCKDSVTGKPIGARLTSCAITNAPFLNSLEGLRAASDTPARMTDLSFNDLRNFLQNAIDEAYPPTSINGAQSTYNYVMDVFDDVVVYERASCYYRVRYTYANGKVALSGEPEKVVRQYASVTATDRRTVAMGGALLDRAVHSPASVMPRLKEALRIHALSSHQDVSDRLGTLREACMSAGEDGMWCGENLHDFMRPLTEMVGPQFGSTYADVLDALDAFVDEEIEKHVFQGVPMPDPPSATMTDATTPETPMAEPTALEIKLTDTENKAKTLEGQVTTLTDKANRLDGEVKTLSEKATKLEVDNGVLQMNLTSAVARADGAEAIVKTVTGAIVLLKDEKLTDGIVRIMAENATLLKDKSDRDAADLRRDVEVAIESYGDARGLTVEKDRGWITAMAMTDRARFVETFAPLTLAEQKLLTKLPAEARTTLTDITPPVEKKSVTGRAREIQMADPSVNYADAYAQAANELRG